MMMDEGALKRQKREAEYSVKTEIKDLPDELVIEILCRLPRNKYVFQCKCVSKHWLSLITSPYFIRSFVANNKQQQQQPWAFAYFKFMMKNLVSHGNFPYKLTDRKDASKLKLISMCPEFQPYEFSLEFLPCYRGEDDQEPITILKTFNDLILCCAEKFDRSECVYYICNPQTKQWVALPPTPPSKYLCVDVEFFCEPYFYTDQGTVILNTQFKFTVVRSLNMLSSRIVQLQIFSSETGQWNMTRISVPRSTQKSFIATSIFCKEKLTLMMVDRCDPTSLSAITFDDFLSPSLKRVKFPGSKFCRSPYYSIMHLSSPLGRVHMVQICINYDANQGVPFLIIWELREEWKLRQKVSFRHMASEGSWISDFYLKKGNFVVEENEELLFHLPIVLGFHLHPYKGYRLYLNLNFDNRMAFYDIRHRTLNLVSETWCHSSFPEYGFSELMWGTVSKFVLPLWPTPVPQISKERFGLEENLSTESALKDHQARLLKAIN